jgi:peptidoglycan/LPS O-acetylase OafA/YrhL
MRRLHCLDGLRGLLALYVMLSHTAPLAFAPAAWAWLPGLFVHGGAAVDAFFILSGLVILRSLEAFRYQPRPFLIARAFRIFPVFLLVFALALLTRRLDPGLAALPWIGPEDPVRLMVSAHWPDAAWAHIAAHLVMAHGLFPDGILPHVWVSLLGVAWSLSTEWQFYLLALLLGLRLAGAPLRLAAAFLALALAGLAWAAIAPPGWGFSRAFLPNKAQYFALGIASLPLLAATQGKAMRRAAAAYTATLAAVLAVSVVQGGWGKLAAPLVWTVCLAAERGLLPPLAWALRTPVLLWLGAISYPLYLVHEPVQKLVLALCAALAEGAGARFNILWLNLGLLLPLLAAWWLHHAVETPAQRWGRALATGHRGSLVRA